MPLIKTLPPKQSLTKLRMALAQLAPLKKSRKRWIRIHPAKIRTPHILHPHPLYGVRLLDLLAGKPLNATLRKVAWMYFIRNSETRLASGEISIVAGKHSNFRLTEGPFVRNAFRTIERARNDRRLRHARFKLQSVRIESLHVFALWLRATARDEFWIVITPIGETIRAGRWLRRNEFAKLLTQEAKRVIASRERQTQLDKGASAWIPRNPQSEL